MAAVQEIRFAAPADREALGGLHRRSAFVWAEDRVHLEAQPDALGLDPEAIADHRVRVAVGEGGQLLGFSIVANAGSGVCELDDLFVEPDFMRQGVGRMLVEDAMARARAGSHRWISVVAHPRNFPFYESVGFLPGEPAMTRLGPAARMWRELM